MYLKGLVYWETNALIILGEQRYVVTDITCYNASVKGREYSIVETETNILVVLEEWFIGCWMCLKYALCSRYYFGLYLYSDASTV